MEKLGKICGTAFFFLTLGVIALTTVGDFLRWREEKENDKMGFEIAFGEAPSTFFSRKPRRSFRKSRRR